MRALVVGAGQHGLAAATVLAREGVVTTVVEARATAGGLCAGETFHPGYSHVGIHHDTELVRAPALKALGLEVRGLALRDAPPVFVPSTDKERAVTLTAAELGRIGQGAGWSSLKAAIDGWKPVIASFLDEPVPPIGAGERPWPLLKRALELRWLGTDRMVELLRVGTLSAEDWLSEHLSDARVRAALALPALLGAWMGPRSPHSGGLLLLREAVSGQEVVGGPAALVRALLAGAQHHGVTFRYGAPVKRLIVQKGRAAGVVLESGEEIAADVVVSSLDPKRTILGLLEPGHLPVDAEDEIRHVRTRSLVAKLHLALSSLPASASRPDLTPERWRVVGDTRELEQAFDDQKYGRLPRKPALDVRVPSLTQDGLAPVGHHVASVLIYGVPASPVGGWTPEARRALLDSALRQLEVDRPGLRDAVVHAELLVPPDLEERYGVSGGHLMHGEHALDQLWVGRPGPRFCRQSTPLPGLFLATGGTHPHGGPSLSAGLFAGRAAAESR